MSTGSNSGITCTDKSKARSACPASTFSICESSTLRSGEAATRTLASSIAFCGASFSACWTISPISDLPYMRLTWAAGTLPGRKPLMFMRGRISAILASSSSARSCIGTVTP